MEWKGGITTYVNVGETSVTEVSDGCVVSTGLQRLDISTDDLDDAAFDGDGVGQGWEYLGCV
jgi:hypothetical protein